MTGPVPPARESEAVRDHIMMCAIPMFIGNGLGATSIDAIAARAKVSKKTIYKYFDDKVDLFRCAVGYGMRGGPKIYEPRDAEGQSPAEAIGNYVRWTYHSYVTPDRIGLYRASIETGSLAPDTAASIRDSFRDSLIWPARYLGQLVRDGMVVCDDVPTAASDLALMAVNGTAHLMGWPALAAHHRPILAEWTSHFFLGGYKGLCALPSARARVPQPFLAGDDIFQPLVPERSRPLAPERRDRLQKAAEIEFAAQGAGGAAIERIAAAAGIGKMTIYRHFAGKDDLFIATVDRLSRALYADTAPLAVSTLALADRLTAIGARALANFVDGASIDLYRLMIREAPRFPDLALTVFRRSENGTVRDIRACLSDVPECQAVSGEAIDYLALQFITLLTNANKFLALPIRPKAAEQSRMVARAVQVFLNGYARFG
ncbi:TetR/AcrR family transcriptional regulator [Sphingobium estronivorans]|uniref:TetR/AcrR family transcriptional regulator n=1 Tax=Sphingobium estronivorans TaxID=1577690 RepID=UPI0013C310BA|nr:TetR/AcrR family transcriptional regulator [Sphingobium estronivorans]